MDIFIQNNSDGIAFFVIPFLSENEPSEDMLQVEIVDQGAGMPPEQLAKLMEPFYSTKDKGTGLGLMMCSNIMEQHNGFLRFESELGAGAKAIVGLRVLQQP